MRYQCYICKLWTDMDFCILWNNGWVDLVLCQLCAKTLGIAEKDGRGN